MNEWTAVDQYFQKNLIGKNSLFEVILGHRQLIELVGREK